MKLHLTLISLLIATLNLSAQDFAISKKVKSHDQITLLASGKNIVALSNKRGDLKLENWDKSLNNRTLIADIDLSFLKEIGEHYLTDAFLVDDKLVIVESVFSEKPNTLGVYVSQYDLKGNLLEPWEKLAEMEQTGKRNIYFNQIYALSPDKSKYVFAITASNTSSKETAKYLVGMYDFGKNQIVLETAVQTEFHVKHIDYSSLSLNNHGEYALWIGGNAYKTEVNAKSHQDIHHIYLGNSQSAETKLFSIEVPEKVVCSTSILMENNGDVTAIGLTMENLKEAQGMDGYFRAVLKNGSQSFDIQTHMWRVGILEKYYSPHKADILQTLPNMTAKNIFLHESGNLTFVCEEYFKTYYDMEYNYNFGSLYALTFDSSGKILKDDLCFKYIRSADLELEGSLAFLSNDTVKIIFSEHPDIWKTGVRVHDLSVLKRSQIHYCSLTCASFGSDGFYYNLVNTKKIKNLCVNMSSTAFLGEKSVVGIGRQVNALKLVRMTLP